MGAMKKNEMTTQEEEAIDRIHLFNQYFESGSGIEFANNQAFSGTLQHSPLRSLCWRLFLEIIPPGTETSAWGSLIDEQRKKYEQLKEQYYVDPHQEQSEDLSVNNPLSQVEDSPWHEYFQNKELQSEINQDIIRTYPEKEFFQSQKTRDIMHNILFIAAKKNPTLGYRQGMHELLAPIIYLFHNQRIPVTEVKDHVVYKANNELYIEHDSFTVFEKLMDLAEPWFLKFDSSGGESSEHRSSPVVAKSNRIQNQLLKAEDPILQAHLTDLQIEPQLYGLRWIRLLFGREFHLDDVLTLWDALFAHGKQLELVEYICLAMLLYVRDQLLQNDYSGCLKRLLNYPPVEDVTLFIDRAIRLMNPSLPKPKVRKDNAKYVEPQKPQVPEKKDPLRDLKGKSTSDAIRVHMANRLERIIYILQQAVVSDTPIERDTLSITVAELKQVKDILNGALDDESIMPLLES